MHEIKEKIPDATIMHNGGQGVSGKFFMMMKFV